MENLMKYHIQGRFLNYALASEDDEEEFFHNILEILEKNQKVSGLVLGTDHSRHGAMSIICFTLHTEDAPEALAEYHAITKEALTEAGYPNIQLSSYTLT